MSRHQWQQLTYYRRERVRLLVGEHASPSHPPQLWQLLPVLPNRRRLRRHNNTASQPGPAKLVRPLRPRWHILFRSFHGVNIQHQGCRTLLRQRLLLRERSRSRRNHRHGNVPADDLHHILALLSAKHTPHPFFSKSPYAEQIGRCEIVRLFRLAHHVAACPKGQLPARCSRRQRPNFLIIKVYHRNRDSL